MPYDNCGHVFTTASHQPARLCEHGVMWVDKIRCNDCAGQVVLRVYDDPRDDKLRDKLPPDGLQVRAAQEKKQP